MAVGLGYSMAIGVIFSGYKVSWCSLHFISCSDVVKIDMSSAQSLPALATIYERVPCLKSLKEEEGTNFIFNTHEHASVSTCPLF